MNILKFAAMGSIWERRLFGEWFGNCLEKKRSFLFMFMFFVVSRPEWVGKVEMERCWHFNVRAEAWEGEPVVEQVKLRVDRLRSRMFASERARSRMFVSERASPLCEDWIVGLELCVDCR